MFSRVDPYGRESTYDSEAPESDAPESEAPERDAPDSEAPDKDAPESEAPESDAPDNEAPESEAPESDAPDNEAPSMESSAWLAVVQAKVTRAAVAMDADKWAALRNMVSPNLSLEPLSCVDTSWNYLDAKGCCFAPSPI